MDNIWKGLSIIFIFAIIFTTGILYGYTYGINNVPVHSKKYVSVEEYNKVVHDRDVYYEGYNKVINHGAN